MSQQVNDLKPLYLSAEEALGLLDLCLISHAEFDREKEGVLLKLSDLVRQYLAEEANEACAFGKVGRADSLSEPPAFSPVSLRYGDNMRLPMSGAEFVAARIATRRTFLKPCPARQFRSMTANSGV